MEFVLESTINGPFYGWKGNTEIILQGGQKWKQVKKEYLIYYFYMPKVKIWKNDSKYFLQMEDVEEMIEIKPIS